MRKTISGMIDKCESAFMRWEAMERYYWKDTSVTPFFPPQSSLYGFLRISLDEALKNFRLHGSRMKKM